MSNILYWKNLLKVLLKGDFLSPRLYLTFHLSKKKPGNTVVGFQLSGGQIHVKAFYRWGNWAEVDFNKKLFLQKVLFLHGRIFSFFLSITITGPWGHSSSNSCIQTHSKQEFYKCIFQGTHWQNLWFICEKLGQIRQANFAGLQNEAECVMICIIK